MAKTFQGSNRAHKSGETVKGNESSVIGRRASSDSVSRGRGGVEQEDWARYYARCCSPANRLMCRCGR